MSVCVCLITWMRSLKCRSGIDRHSVINGKDGQMGHPFLLFYCCSSVW